MTLVADSSIEHFGFFLVPGFSMISLAAVVDPLRMANRISDKELYTWDFYCHHDETITASNGLPFSPSRKQNDIRDLDTLFVVAGIDAHQANDASLLSWLRSLKQQKINLGSTSTGSLLLAKAGILKNQRCTIHWENQDSLSEQFPDLQVTGELYEIDRDVMTCSGGLAGLDLMLQLISLKHGESLAKDVAEQCIHPAIRPAYDKQRMDLQLRHHAHHPRLLKALELMRSNIEEVLTCQEIGDLVGLSVRQMERLFKSFLSTTPANHYLQLRLERAHHLVLQSNLSMMQISTACGFSSTSYFSRCYRKQYHCSPREERLSTHT
ncbi:GlxA family transcriptional regulator [Marinomonas sp. 15G1-11]|uniref:GlxA family transcriptional regulator n=1 Tax=Marinomonas phaeophyticola TaxID=3004091 RepID=A0ABT4JRH0_9GAMM|nr:GlxA family transcriptional regulator [Marinomonas sp. 15G1-11]MCZ2720934.1 GlxA family transcriptional regulator [Marinomonas sp. 15G1-11]